MLAIDPANRPIAMARGWGSLSLALRFILASAFVLVVGMAVIGVWVSTRIATDVTRNTAVATALYVDSVIAPLTQELTSASSLSQGARLALSETLENGVLGDRIRSFKLWSPEGVVVFASDETLIGRRFETGGGLAAAVTGGVHGELDQLDTPEDAGERRLGVPLLEIYAPIREPWSGDVVAVAEFYEDATELSSDIARATVRSWLVVGGVTLAMMALLFGIVAGGSRQIAAQRRALDGQVAQLSGLLGQNEALRRRLQQASRRTTLLNERHLRRISADLHDGPAQYLSYALLRLDKASGSMQPEAAAQLRQALDEAMKEIRNISRGAALPELDHLTAEGVAREAARAHEARSATPVALEIEGPLPPLRQAEKICLYRFVQETLNNATRHAEGADLGVRVYVEDGELAVVTRDGGPGMSADDARGGLGLAGLEERVAALEGRFAISSVPGGGTRVTMTIPLTSTEGGSAIE